MSSVRSEKVATPPTAATVSVPASVGPGALELAIATVTEPVKPVAKLPNASNAETWTAGRRAIFLSFVPGDTVKRSALAGPGTMLKAAVVVPAKPVAVAVRV